MDFLRELSKVYDLSLKINEPMKKHTSFGVGGSAKFFCDIKSLYSLSNAVTIAKKCNIPYKIIGNGSNILVSDQGFNGIIFCVKNLSDIFFKRDEIYAMCGANLNKLIEFARLNNLSGLEQFVGIPATIGGAVFMNAGAFGQSIGDRISTVETIYRGKLKRYDKSDCKFGYRKSRFTNSKEIIVSATFSLTGSNKEDILKKESYYLEKRKKNQPKGRTCGSVFRNPKGEYAGKLIESAGLKGYGNSNCYVSNKHCNFIIASSGATASDIYSLIQYIKKKVKVNFDIQLCEEVEFIGEFNGINFWLPYAYYF